MKRKILVFGIALTLLIAIVSLARILNSYNFEKEMKSIEFDQVRLFMSQSEVEKLHGLGRDLTHGCFGCEMNFVYTDINLSGRYSETYNRMNGTNINHNKSPKVKRMETASKSNEIFNIRVGDTFEKAEQILKTKGFQKIDSGIYKKNNYMIEVLDDTEINDMKIKSIAVSYNVEKDNQIQY